MFLVFCKTCHGVGGARTGTNYALFRDGTLVFGVQYIRVAVDWSFFPNSNLIDMLEMFSANRMHTFPGCFWGIRRVVFLLLHLGQRISSQWEAWCCHWNKVHWKNLQWCCSSYCQVRGWNYVRNWQGLETVWQSPVNLRVDITLIQRFSDPIWGAAVRFWIAPQECKQEHTKPWQISKLFLVGRMKEVFFVLILTNNQMEKHFLRTSSRVLRGSQILKSSIIADENNLEAQQKGAEEESHTRFGKQ